jgi:glycerol dehydrogenase-like iron-containing ADH family enzyme
MYAALIGPAKYVQGRGALAEIGTLLRPLGERALILADKNIWKLKRRLDLRPHAARRELPGVEVSLCLRGGDAAKRLLAWPVVVEVHQ